MPGWTQHSGLAVGLPSEGIDTDQLIPARFMSTPRSEGYGQFLLHDVRAAGGCPLDAPAAKGASILVARRNFGGGSSREAAVYALVDYGIRAVIAPSFGDIFAGNAVNNGLLAARVTEAEAEVLLDALAAPVELAIDLGASRIAGAGLQLSFALDPVARTKLINGWDDLDLTASLNDEIAHFAVRDRALRDWAYLTGGGG